MRVKSWLLAAILLVPGQGTAQFLGGKVSLYSDLAFTDTIACDTGVGTLAIHVVWEDPNESARDVLFMIAGSAGFTGTWLEDSTPYTVVGTSQEGVGIVFPTCMPSPIHALTVTYAIDGTSSANSYVEVVPHPGTPTGMIEVNVCVYIEFARGGRLLVNPEGVCPPLPTEPTTWGAIKALYE